LANKTKIGIFIDYDNLFFTTRELYGISPTEKINNHILIEQILEKYNDCHIVICNAYADFQLITNLARDLNTMYELQSRRISIKNVFGNNIKNENRKNASDIELSIDIMESLHTNPDIEKYVIVSADSDMIPIMNRLKYADKYVELYYLDYCRAQDGSLLNYANENIAVESLVNLSDRGIAESDIENLYLKPIMEKIIKLDNQNLINKNGNYIGLLWLKNQLQSKGFFSVNNQSISLSGINVGILIEFLKNKNFILISTDKKSIEIKPNYNNVVLKEMFNL